jgi:probable phosphoglycerate mutase
LIILVRHGRTEANHRGLLLGRADPRLDETGIVQVAALADYLAQELIGRKINAVVTSPLLRTQETAAAIGHALAVTPEVDERLIEMNYGEWDQLPVDEIAPEVWKQWRVDPDFSPPGGESLAQVQIRVGQCLDDLVRRAHSPDPDSPGGVVVAVSHTSPIKAALVWALRGSPELAWRFRLSVASITEITLGPFGPVVTRFNETVTPSVG